MTDTPDAHARPSGRAPGARPPAPAAHNHPDRPGVPATVAVMDPKQMPPAFGWPAPQRGSGAGEPPPFGFNAPGAKPEEEETSLPGTALEPEGGAEAAPVAPAAGATGTEPVPVAEPPAESSRRPFSAPAFERPFIPMRPPSSSLAPPTAQPRELMPSALPAERRRLGDTMTPTFGPPGRHRSLAAMTLLSVLTLGIYSIAWHRRVNQEMGDFDPRIHVHPARSAWAVFLPWIAGLLGSAAAAGIVLSSHYGVDLHLGVSAHQVLPGLAALAAVPYLVLFIPFSLVAVVLTAERVRLVEEHAGMTTFEQIRPAAVVGWLLFPLIGGLVLMGRQQSHLNRIWDLAEE
jgi:hypothetical protein